MDLSLEFNPDLLRRYDLTGPRYTSYPTAVQFQNEFEASDYRLHIEESNEDPIPLPISLYVHIPFCDTICFYCACNKIVSKDHGRSVAYLEHLQQEIALVGNLIDPDRTVDQLHWGGGTPTFLNREQIQDLMHCIASHFNLRTDDTGEYSIEIDPRTVNEETIAMLRAAGFNRISLGVQDFDPRVQKAVNRIQSEQQTAQVIEAARKHKFTSINVDLMYGLPLQTTASFEKTIEKIIEKNPDRIAIYNYAHLPERFKSQRRILEDDLPSPSMKLAMLENTIQQLLGAGYAFIGMDHFAKSADELAVAQRNGTLTRNFQGYSTHSDCDLVALGVTAISQVHECYSQNMHGLDDYYEAVERGRIPVERGIELEPDDLLRREIITRLSCHFVLDIAALELKWHFSFTNYFQQEKIKLQNMQADGLLELTDASLRVLPRGRLLVRNICMVFDRYLGEPHINAKFSRVI